MNNDLLIDVQRPIFQYKSWRVKIIQYIDWGEGVGILPGVIQGPLGSFDETYTMRAWCDAEITDYRYNSFEKYFAFRTEDEALVFYLRFS